MIWHDSTNNDRICSPFVWPPGPTFRTLQARIAGALGGRAAEQLVFGSGQVTTGAGGDLQQAGNRMGWTWTDGSDDG